MKPWIFSDSLSSLPFITHTHQIGTLAVCAINEFHTKPRRSNLWKWVVGTTTGRGHMRKAVNHSLIFMCAQNLIRCESMGNDERKGCWRGVDRSMLGWA